MYCCCVTKSVQKGCKLYLSLVCKNLNDFLFFFFFFVVTKLIIHTLMACLLLYIIIFLIFFTHNLTKCTGKHPTKLLQAWRLFFVCIKFNNTCYRWVITTVNHALFITGRMHPATTKHFSVCITLCPPTKMNNGRKTKPCTVSSIANGTSRLILACSHSQPNNICDMCVHGRGNKAISEVIWAESVMVQWQCFVLVVRKKTQRGE